MSDLLQKFQSLMAKMAIIFAGLGIFFSLLGSIIGTVGFPAMLVQPMFYGFLMSLLGVSIFFTWKQFIPEIIEEYGFYSNNVSEENREELDAEQAMVNTETEAENLDSNSEKSIDMADDASLSGKNRSSKSGVEVKGDELIVEGVAIKNEPKVMASAIMHLLDSDEG